MHLWRNPRFCFSDLFMAWQACQWGYPKELEEIFHFHGHHATHPHTFRVSLALGPLQVLLYSAIRNSGTYPDIVVSPVFGGEYSTLLFRLASSK